MRNEGWEPGDARKKRIGRLRTTLRIRMSGEEHMGRGELRGGGKGEKRRNDEKKAGDERKKSIGRGKEKLGIRRGATKKTWD